MATPPPRSTDALRLYGDYIGPRACAQRARCAPSGAFREEGDGEEGGEGKGGEQEFREIYHSQAHQPNSHQAY